MFWISWLITNLVINLLTVLILIASGFIFQFNMFLKVRRCCWRVRVCLCRTSFHSSWDVRPMSTQTKIGRSTLVDWTVSTSAAIQSNTYS